MRDRASREDLITPCVSLLARLALDQLPPDWSDSVWDGQFTETADLPPDYEEVAAGADVGEVFSRLTETITRWIQTQSTGAAAEESGEDMNTTSQSDLYRAGFWQIMTEQNVKYKALISLLCHYMEKGMQMFREERERQLGLRAASLYLVILGLPGSGAFKIFHSVLFSRALDTLTLVTKLKINTAAEPARRGKKASQQSQSQSQRRRNVSGEEEDEVVLTQREAEKVVVALVKVLECLHVMLDTCSLKRSEESVDTLVQHLVTLTRLETQFTNLDMGEAGGPQRHGDVSSLALNSYLAMMKLCAPLHGPGAGAVLVVLRALVPGILMVGEGSARALSVHRANCLRFVRVLMKGGGRQVSEAAVILVQHLAARVPDKADYRREAAEAIVTLLTALPTDLRNEVVRWFIRYCHSEKATSRLFSLEVVGRLMYTTAAAAEEAGNQNGEMVADGDGDTSAAQEALGEREKGARGNPGAEDEESSPGPSPPRQPPPTVSFLFAVIYGRCGDVSASVRTQALKSLGDITTEQSPEVKEVITRIFSADKEDRGQVVMTQLLEDEDTDLAAVDLLPSGAELIAFLRKRALDQSVFVRKSALQVLENILKSSTSLVAGDLVSVLAEHCRDSSLAVRKQMVISLTELVKTYPGNEALVRTWVDGVFPLILDVEAKAAEKVLECIWECLFGNLVHVSRAATVEHQLPWLILQQVEACKMANYLSRACNTWAKEAKLSNTVLHNIQSYIGTDHNGSTWMLFGLISAHVPCKDPGMVMDYFNASIVNPEGVGLYTLLQVLKVLFASVSNLSKEDRLSLQSNLLNLVKKFKIPPELISTAMDVITVVSSLQVDNKDNMKQYQSAVDSWTAPILDTIDQHLTSVLLTESPGTNVDEELLTRQIFSLGELAQVSPHRISKRMFLLLKSIVFQSQPDTSATATTLAPPSTQTQSSQPPAIQFVPSQQLQSLVVVSLGKMCLQNEDQAKKIIPAFGNLLDGSQDPAMKNNIMYALTDMCVRYASLVDPLLPQMTACLKDKYPSVRRTTLILLIHLLQEDYLKIRGNGKFFFRILHTLLDPSSEIRHLTTFYIQQRMLKRNSKIMYSNFVESIFHFNDYQDHSSFNKFSVSDKEKVLFDLSGERKMKSRRDLYKFMLENMNDEQKFQITYKLCQDVLGGVVEDSIKLTPASNPLLKDTFHVLASDAIKLTSLKSKAAEDVPETEEDRAGMVMEAAKKQIISNVVKKNVMENIIPIIIGLKHKLEAVKSPLISELFNYLRKLMEDYKNEVTEILAADKQLAKEIEFDLRRHEQEEQERREREAQERLRPVRSRTSSPARTQSPGSRRGSTTSGRMSPSAAGVGTAPATPASGQKRERRNLARLALENAMSRTGQKKGEGARKSKSCPDTTQTSTLEQSSNKTKSSPGMETGGGHDVSVGVSPLNGTNAGENMDQDDGEESNTSKDVTSRNKTTDNHQHNNVKDTTITNKDDNNTEEEPNSTLKAIEPEKEKESVGSTAIQSKDDNNDVKDNEKEAEDENATLESGEPEKEASISNDEVTDKEKGSNTDNPHEANEINKNKDDLDKSKRVSGQGMPRPRTPPRNKRQHNLRAISTPQVNKTVLGDNVTFMGDSIMDVSAITVLSPQSVASDADSRPSQRARAGAQDDTDAVSFRFKKGGQRDLFDNLVNTDTGAAAAAANSKSPEKSKRPSSTGTAEDTETHAKRKKDLSSPAKEKNPPPLKKSRSVSRPSASEQEEGAGSDPDKVDWKKKVSRKK